MSTADRSRSPVFVLCTARSGSTLLRFILDSHPNLACPPEVGPGRACAALAGVMDALRGDKPRERLADPDVPIVLEAETANAVRDAVERPFTEYANHRGRGRWCDKSLDNAMFAPLLAQVFPDAGFICLYRQCLDVIDSGLEASPWGLASFGFAAHAAEFPGNNVAAIAHYWLTTTRLIAQFEADNPQRCLRLRYEDLVVAPEEVANGVFAFLGEQPIPGISELCLRSQHDRYGPADQKIWFTDKITTASVGRGERVPVAAIPPPMREEIDQLLADLDYATLDQKADAPDPAGADDIAPQEDHAMLSDLLERLAQCPSDRSAEVLRRWPILVGCSIDIRVGDTWNRSAGAVWSFAVAPDADSPELGTVASGQEDQDRLSLLASKSTWRALVSGQTNMAIELVAGSVRLDHHDERDVLREPPVLGLCVLLGISDLSSVPNPDAHRSQDGDDAAPARPLRRVLREALRIGAAAGGKNERPPAEVDAP